MTAETESNQPDLGSTAPPGTSIARIHLTAAVAFLIVGSLVASIAAFQLVVPDFLSGIALTTYGRLAPAGRILLVDGWLTLGILGLSYVAIARIVGSEVRRAPLALAGAAVIALGVVAGAVGVLVGFQSGIVGQAAPIWARAVLLVGYLLATIALVATARTGRDSLGATGWYLTAAPIWLTLSGIVAVVPLPDGIAGTVQAAFATEGTFGLFVVTASVGLLYHVFTSITGTDPTAPRPLATLGFWSLSLVWANLAASRLIYSPTPDWYETLAVAFAIGALVPLLTIATDLGLMLRGSTATITDRGSLRYAVVASLSLALATISLLLLTWRATSAIAQFTTWVDGLDALIVLGGGSFAIFAAASVMRGGRTGGPSLHLVLSVVGVLTMVAGLLVGGVVVGFSWAAGPASQVYANSGDAWKVTADTTAPFLWIAAVGVAIFTVAQIVYAVTVGRGAPAPEADTDPRPDFDLEFAGTPRYATWGRLMAGVIGVWVFAAVMTWALPALDGTDRDATILADTARTYEAGSAQAIGRDLYVSEGCIACHTQQVRPIGTDVGLGPVSIAGDYAHEVPPLLGSHRYGPDLMHYAGSVEFFDKVIIEAKLEDPRAVTPWSTMPSYSYLSPEDLTALISYIETLR